MTTKLCVVAALIAGAFAVQGRAESNTLPEAVVAVTEEQIPVRQSQADDFVWHRFSKKEREADVPILKLSEWEALRDHYVSALVSKAKAAGLEADSLARILERIDRERGKKAVIPIEAYRSTQADRQVWVVVCRWEIQMEAAPKRDPAQPDLRVGHQQVFAYDIATLQRVAYNTCL